MILTPSPEQVRLGLIVIAFKLISGLGDALGFIHAGRVWQGSQFIWREALASAVAFQCGAFAFWMALRFLQALGVITPETQTLLWFGATTAGIAILRGRFFHWPIADQIVALAVLVGIGWLLFRTGG
jgi:hypothetical protein